MKTKKQLQFLLLLWLLSIASESLYSQSQFLERTYTIENYNRQSWRMGVNCDEITILASSGVTWLKISGNGTADWERAANVLYDDPPIRGFNIVCPKIEYEPGLWSTVNSLHVFAWGEKGSTITIRIKKLPLAISYTPEGNFVDTERDYGSITTNPQSAGPGDNVNITVTIPNRTRRHIDGVQLILPEPNAIETTTVDLPYSLTGIYYYSWQVPTNEFYMNKPTGDVIIRYTAMANKLSENGQFKRLSSGLARVKISGELSADISIQNQGRVDGTWAIWRNYVDKSIAGFITRGQPPYTTEWIIDGEVINNAPQYHEYSKSRKYNNSTVLNNAETITFRVSDANGNTASKTIIVGFSDMTFAFWVNGVEVPFGESIMRKAGRPLILNGRTKNGKQPFQAKWIINDGGYVYDQNDIHSNDITLRFAANVEEENEIILKTRKVSLELTDANGNQRTGTIYINSNPEEDENDDKDDTKNGCGPPVGPQPTPPPLSGDPNQGANPEIEWDKKPWLDERVQSCTREYLDKIVFKMANEYRVWENTGCDEFHKKPLFTRIDDWGRIFSPNMSATANVDGSWSNPTHFVWSEYNKKTYAEERFGRTVEYYVKYECALLEPPMESIDEAIDDLIDDDENAVWDAEKIQLALEEFNELLEILRDLYNGFNINYDKFINEINDQNAVPQENSLIAFCLVTAQNRYDDHGIDLDTINALGTELLAQAANSDEFEIFDIIRALSEVETQSNDMEKKLNEMKELLTNYGADIDEVIEIGEQFAQDGVDPEFAQDGGMNIEIMGDGIDNISDGIEDYIYGATRTGNVLICLFDAGDVKDDIIEARLSTGVNLGRTQPGSTQYYDLKLDPGQYTLTIRGILTLQGIVTAGIIIWNNDQVLLDEYVPLEVGQEEPFEFNVYE